MEATRPAARRRLAPRAVPASLVALSIAIAFGAAGPADAATAKVRCKIGEIPATGGTAAKPTLLKTKAGKAKCKTPPKAKPERIEPAAQTSQGSVASTADQITQALTVKPDALAKTEKKIGKKATKALVDRAINGWRTAARAEARGRRLADDGSYHFQGSFGDATKGTTASARIDAGPAGEGGAGIAATALIEFSADGAGLKSLGADKITDAKSAKVKLEISFEDAPTQCPTAAGKVKGAVKASATLTLTTDGTVQTMSAKVSSTYELTVGGDARWKTIDGVDVQTEFSFGGTGKSTETWRGRRGGEGFGERGIFGEGSGDLTAAIDEQASHVNPRKGGVWGPRGRVLFNVPSTDNFLNYGGSVAHLKGMILTDVATTYLLYAAVEYIRHVVAPRGQKHWYDAEACLKLDGSADKARLGPGETATVTAKNAKAFDGTPVGVSTTATGVAAITPGSATIAAGGSADHTLTAPTTSPVKATWNVVALSPAGKKTVNGAIGDQPRFKISFVDHQRGVFALYHGSATMTGELTPSIVERGAVTTSTATGPVTYSQMVGVMDEDPQYCDLRNPVSGGEWTATIKDAGTGTVEVALDFTKEAQVTYTYSCDYPPDCATCDDPPPFAVPGSAVVIAVSFAPRTFTIPVTGDTAPITVPVKGEVSDAGHGLFSDGVITVTPIP